MNIPPYLKEGDKIGILSTARKISSTEIHDAMHLVESWGCSVFKGLTIDTAHNQFAGDDEFRLNDFQQMLYNPEIKAIWCARGGYGTVRFIDKIDFRKFQKKPKWICGFSDVTALHSHIHQLSEIPTIHSMMAFNVNENTLNVAETLRQCLFGEKIHYTFSAYPLNKIGKVKAKIVGGNLSMLYSLSASISDLNTDGKILLLEDLDEYVYHIDRMMMQLKRSGKLENLTGLIVGGMTDMKDNTIPFGKNAEEIIAEHVEEFDFPVCFNFPIGHQLKNNAVKLGMEADLTVSEQEVIFKQN
jgi:muramoyltetrapeptide carboxypeptidase